MMKKVSVIVPIYKVASYLKKCVNSILDQSYENLDIILVDDGSPDDCPLICDEYEKKDLRVRVIHKVNGGLSDARNAGIEIIRGEYVVFVDSDDFLETRYIERLVNCLESTNSDIAICDYYTFGEKSFNGCKLSENKSPEIFNNENALKCALVGNPFALSAWGKLYKSSLFANVRYPKGKIYEDLGTIYKIIGLANKICYVPEKRYYYLIRKNSISYAKFSTKKMDMLFYSKEILSYIENYFPQIVDEAKIRVAISAIDLLRDMDLNKDKETVLCREKCYDILKEYRGKVLRNNKVNVKYRFFSMTSYCGKYAVGFIERLNRKIK